MSDWANEGLPSGQRKGYAYMVDAGLERTPFDTSQPRQQRINTLGRREFTVAFQLTHAQLQDAITFLEAQGSDWFTMPLLSGEDTNSPCFDLTVRIITDYEVAPVGLKTGYYSLSFQVEQKKTDFITDGQYVSHLYTTTPYAIEQTESMECARSAVTSIVISGGPLEEMECDPSPPLNISLLVTIIIITTSITESMECEAQAPLDASLYVTADFISTSITESMECDPQGPQDGTLTTTITLESYSLNESMECEPQGPSDGTLI